MPLLPPSPTLLTFQKYIAQMIKERGFQKESVSEILMLLIEECGELAKALRKRQNLHLDSNSKSHDLAHEAADVFMVLLDLCNACDIDLEKAFREKEAINEKRIWSKQ